MRRIVSVFSILWLLCSCYYQASDTPDAWNLTEQQVDSISFYTTHHYTENFNFLVTADSLQLIAQHPAEQASGLIVDTFSLVHGERIVVADVTTISTDTIDSIWVKVARDQQTFGWVREKQMLPAVSPDAPVSRFIDFFSDTHLLIFLAIIALLAASFILRKLMRLGAKIVHFNDIDSFYPTLLTLLISASAVFYSTIQLFAPESWRHYYYHPTLNPFSVPIHLGLFLLSVWAIIVTSIATFDDVRRKLGTGEALFYGLGLVGVCAVDYVVFSVSTLYYLGYPLLVAYATFALHQYFRNSRIKYSCGRCGAPLHEKGRCPHCGTLNT